MKPVLAVVLATVATSVWQAEVADANAAELGVEVYPRPVHATPGTNFLVTAGGQGIFVERFTDVDVAQFAFQGEIPVTVRVAGTMSKIDVSPHAAQLAVQRDGDLLTFRLPQPMSVVLTIDGRRLLLLADGIDNEAPQPGLAEVRSVLDFGVDPSGGTLDTVRLQRAIDEVAAAHGTLFFPPGEYLTGTLALKSNLTFYLAAGARLLGSINPADYPVDAGFTESQGENFTPTFSIKGVDMTYSRLLLVDGASHVRIAGRGTIDGQGRQVRNQGKPANLLRIRNSSDVTVEGVTLRDPAAWNTHILYSDHVTIRGVKLLNDRSVLNSDGFDPDSSQDVLIERCFILAGDDAIAIKTSGNSKLLRSAERIAMRGCTIMTKKSAMKIGTETRAEAVSNITFADNNVIEAARAMTLNCYDGARFEHLRFERNRLESIFTPEKQQRLLMFQVKNRDGAQPGLIRDVLIADTASEVDSPEPSLMEGFDADHTISDVRFVNYTVAGRLCRNAADAKLDLKKFVENVTFSVVPATPDSK